MSTSPWVPIAQACDYYQLSDDTLRRMISRGEIEARRFGPKLIRVNIDSILDAARPLQYSAESAA